LISGRSLEQLHFPTSKNALVADFVAEVGCD
jgi:hypothetical protein